MKSDRLAYPFEYILIMEKAWTEFLVISSTMWKEGEEYDDGIDIYSHIYENERDAKVLHKKYLWLKKKNWLWIAMSE
jgi:hypothetical protein